MCILQEREHERGVEKKLKRNSEVIYPKFEIMRMKFILEKGRLNINEEEIKEVLSLLRKEK